MNSRTTLFQIIDRDGKCLAASDQLKKNFCSSGLCHQVLLGQKTACSDACPFAQVFKQKKEQSFEFRPSLDAPSLQIRLVPLFGDDGQVREVLELVSLAGQESLKKLEKKAMHAMEQSYKSALAEAFQKTVALRKTKRETDAEKTFIRLAAHQMQPPIQILRGVLELFLANPSAEKAERLSQELDHLGSSVRKLLQLAHLQSREVDLSLKKTDLGPLLQKIFDRVSASDSGHKLHFSFPKKQKIEAAVSTEFFPEAVAVLLENAVKYTPAKSRIDVSLKKTESEILISVRNEGAGISASAQKNLFRPFFRASPEKPGTGLGLVLAREIVQMHGGEISVESDGKTFTQFTISLPQK